MDRNISAIVPAGVDEWLILERPVRIVSAEDTSSVVSAIAEVEALTRGHGYHAVGFVSYEAGAAFGLKVRPSTERFPLVCFALFEASTVRTSGRLPADGSYELGTLTPSVTEAAFNEAFIRIKRHLADGDAYQVNYTFQLQGTFRGDAGSLWLDLVSAQQGKYSVFLRLGNDVICSASPELFFYRRGDKLWARPMKGTARRGRTIAEDAKQRERLRASEKEQAENVMIVDMMRNDLGRIATIGSVHVPDLFSIERYPTVWQMTSLITAQSDAPLTAIFTALHPSASVTGAPKVRTMEILADLETSSRGVYTGAVGHIAPDGKACFNVAIRTAVVDELAGTLVFGIGSGIVWDSDPDQEYEECLLKGAVIADSRRRANSFELLETMRWTPDGGVFLLARHLARLRDSAEYFDFKFHGEAIRAALTREIAHWGSGQDLSPQRVRLMLSRDGGVRLEHSPLQPSRLPLRVGLVSQPIDADDVFLYHKTTNRSVYDRFRSSELDDVLLWNAQRHITEASTANIVVELGGARVTPPVESGLLAGTYRAELLSRGEIQEGTVTVDDLNEASRIWLINSVHEWRRAIL